MTYTAEKMLQRLLDCQIVERPEQVVLLKDEPPLPNYICYPHAYNAMRQSGVFGLSLDLDPVVTQLKSAAECLERIALYQCHVTERKPLDSNDLMLADRPFIDIATDRSQHFHFVPAIELPSKHPTLVPAQLVYFNSPRETVSLRVERTSCGTACGNSDDQSCLSRGLLELLERHYCYRAFYHKTPVVPIRIPCRATQELIDTLTHYEMEVRLFSISNEYNLPVVFAMILDHRVDYPAVRCGSKASFNWGEACNGAICEAIQSRRIMRINQAAGRMPRFQITDAGLVCNALQRYSYWLDGSRIPALLQHFNVSESETCSLPELPTLESLMQALTRAGHRILFCDVTPAILAQHGIQVAKVVASGFDSLPEDERHAQRNVNTVRSHLTTLPHPWC